MQRYARLFSILMMLNATVAMPAHAIDDDIYVTSDADAVNDADVFTPPPVAVAPPPLPVYEVPPPPYEEYAWMPGHWRWNGYEYFWIPGTWVRPPYENVVWTPGYWDWDGYAFEWHEGYWSETVGYYGGIYYGGGYDGSRFYGGSWVRGHYEYNPAIIRERYVTRNYVSFHGGPGGILSAPTRQQRLAERERHFELTHEQREHMQLAEHNPAFRATANHGKPAVVATSTAGDFHHAFAADHAGPRNAAAAEHNAAVRQNPSVTHGAALPERQPQTAPAPQASRIASPIMAVEPGQAGHAIVEPAPQPEAIRPQHLYQPREPAVAIARPEPVLQPVPEPQRAVQEPPHPQQEHGHTRPMPPQMPTAHPAAAPEPAKQPPAQAHGQEGHHDAQDKHGQMEQNHP